MKLLEEPSFTQRSHHVADGCRAHSIFVVQLTRHGLRGDRLSGRDINFDDRVQDQPLAGADPKVGRHFSPAAAHFELVAPPVKNALSRSFHTGLDRKSAQALHYKF
jgi:hypothetical protein